MEKLWMYSNQKNGIARPILPIADGFFTDKDSHLIGMDLSDYFKSPRLASYYVGPWE